MSRDANEPDPIRRRTGRRRRTAGAVLAAGCLAAVTVPASPAAASDPGASGDGSTALAAAQPSPPGPGAVLPHASNGQAALDRIGDRLPAVAARNGRTAVELAHLLRTDSTLWLDTGGRLQARDTDVPDGPGARAAAAPYPVASTFRLHSRPGAERTIFLDFDGHTVAGTVWNEAGISTRPQPAFDLDGSPGRWAPAEHDVVQSVFQRVAEDFAPFAVDVTSEDPGEAALARSSAADSRYGTRVLITPTGEELCGNSGAGCAMIGIFDRVGNTRSQPAWVRSDTLSNDAKYIAEAASHEAGHNLGLSHDGTTGQVYYSGHGNWAPIMGSAYSAPVSQWSRGEYRDANNREDDIAVLARHGLPLVADDHGSTPATGTAVGAAASATGLIRSRIDSDLFSFARACAGTATVTARPAPTGPDLDIELRLRNRAGALLARSDPPSGDAGLDLPTGLAASVTVPLPAGTYTVEIDGAGVRTPATGYSDYGSRGRYTVEFSRCPLAPTSRLLLVPGDLGGVPGGAWATRGENLTPIATVEPLASCSGTATLSPSVARSFAGTGASPAPGIDQRVVRYQPGRGDAVLDLFRRVVAQCPVRTTPLGVRESWSTVADTAGPTTDALVLRRTPLDAPRAPVSYAVVTRHGDVVSVLRYAPAGAAAGNDAGARALAAVTATRLGSG